MPVKDYYKILELPPGAGEEEVKKNFRRLAIRFHPDKTGGNRYKDAWYREIQEAYKVLSDPMRKQEYLQQRWLLKSKGHAFAETFPLTPDYIEKSFARMREKVSQMDHFRMDHEALKNQLLELCNDEILNALSEGNDAAANTQIIGHLLYCMDPLDYKRSLFLQKLLYVLARPTPGGALLVAQWYNRKKRAYWWEKNHWWILALSAVAACAAIALLVQKSLPQ